MTEKLHIWLKENRDLIEHEEWEHLYNKLRVDLGDGRCCAEFTESILHIFNPLEEMDQVPTCYLTHSSALDHIVIPDNIKRVGRSAFYMSNIQSVYFNGTSNCFTIDISAFSDCYNLKNVVLPPKCQRILTYAFDSCNNLESVVIPTRADFVSISEGAFSDCPRLKIYCYPGPVEEYCIETKIPYKLIEDKPRENKL